MTEIKKDGAKQPPCQKLAKKSLKKVAQESRKQERQGSESNSSSKGKIMTVKIEPNKHKIQIQEDLQVKIETMQVQIFKFEAKIYNQNIQIRKLTNFIVQYQKINLSKTTQQRQSNSENNPNKILKILKKRNLKNSHYRVKKN